MHPRQRLKRCVIQNRQLAGEGVFYRAISKDKLLISLQDDTRVFIKLASVSSSIEAYSWEAIQALHQMLANQRVRFSSLNELQPQVLLGDVYLPSGQSATEMLLRSGLASIQHCPYVPKKHFKYLRKLECEARTAKRGIWAVGQEVELSEQSAKKVNRGLWAIRQEPPSSGKLCVKGMLQKEIQCVVVWVESINRIHVATIPDNFHIVVTIPGSLNVVNAKTLKMLATKHLLHKQVELKLETFDIGTNKFFGRITKPDLMELCYALHRSRRQKPKRIEDVGRTSKLLQKRKWNKNRPNIYNSGRNNQSLLRDVKNILKKKAVKQPKHVLAPTVKILKGKSAGTIQLTLQDMNDVLQKNTVNQHQHTLATEVEALKQNSSAATQPLLLDVNDNLTKKAVNQHKHLFATEAEVLKGSSGTIIQPLLPDVNDILWKTALKQHRHRSAATGKLPKGKSVTTIQPPLRDLNDIFWRKAVNRHRHMPATVVEVLKGNSFTLRVGNRTVENVYLSNVNFPWECSDMRHLCTEAIHNLRLVSLYYTNRLRTRELLRKLLLDNRVGIAVNYIDTTSKRMYCSMSVLGVNLDQELVKASVDNRPCNLHINVAWCKDEVCQLWEVLQTKQETTVVVEQVLSPSYIILLSLELQWLFAFSLIEFEELRGANPGVSKKHWKETVTKMIAKMCHQKNVSLQATSVGHNGVFHGDLKMKGCNLRDELLQKIRKRYYHIHVGMTFELRSYRVISKRKIKIPVEDMYGRTLRPKHAIFALWMKKKRIKKAGILC